MVDEKGLSPYRGLRTCGRKLGDGDEAAMDLQEWFGQAWQVILGIWGLLVPIVRLILPLLPVALWLAFWTWAVDWKKFGPVLRAGGWAPVLLLCLISAAVWANVSPGVCNCLGFVTLANFWWQLGTTLALAACALVGGWLQKYFGIHPLEISFEPPAHEHGHGHGHGHGQGHEHHAEH